MNTFGVLGGDARQRAVAATLKQLGYAVQTLGLYEQEEEEKALGAQVYIMGLPCTKDGQSLWMPLCEKKRALWDVTSQIKKGQWIFGGNLPLELVFQWEQSGARVVDYFKSEALAIHNAQLTAEGTIGLLLSHLPHALLGARVVLLGYGRIARALAPLLQAFHTEITVVARRAEQRAWVQSIGCRAVPFTELSQVLPAADIILNTAPSLLLDEELLGQVPKTCMIVELASAPGGIDLEAAQRLGITVVPAPGLPGLYSPQTAGELIALQVLAMLEEET